MPSYNMTTLGNAETVAELFLYADTAANNILFGLILFALFFIMLMVLKRWEFDKALLSSSFACFILALILSFASLLNFIFVLLFLMIMAFTGFFMYIRN